MKKLTVLLAFAVAFNASAQMVVSAPTVELNQQTNNKLQSVMKAIQNEGLKQTIDIRKYQEALTSVTNDFYQGLKMISQSVFNAQSVKSTIDIQKMYMEAYYLKTATISNKLVGPIKTAFLVIQKAGLRLSFEKVSELKVILTPNYFQMSDAERLDKIEKIKEDLQELYYGMLAFCKNAEIIITLKDAYKPKTIEELNQEFKIK